LQGSNIAEHFYRIGFQAAEPWLSLAKKLASKELPPKPDNWHIQSGWTKYYYLPDGSSYSEHVEVPIHNNKPEEMLTFDVETMPKYHPYAIMACAASPNAWYTWISPWLLQESEDPQHLIPFGGPEIPRVVVGHNVSYDRIRMLDEYNVTGTQTRFLDTMSLHVAVNGISSHQRPAWMKYRKSKQLEEEQKVEAVQAVLNLMRTVDERRKQEADLVKQEELLQAYQEMEESLVLLQSQDDSGVEPDIAADEAITKRWEDLTSSNSLAEVARLHCGIEVRKEIRNDLLTMEPEHIRSNIVDYLEYCATDVEVTHKVYAAILPGFLVACPHPVSFSGVLTMGSSFLPVDENWEDYLQKAEAVCGEMEGKVQMKLKRLAEDARGLMNDQEKWALDPWLSQMDWTPKVAGKSRGIFPPEEVSIAMSAIKHH
jgi:DNA polymerase gamma 1